MDGLFDFLPSLDPYHQRIGYLGCLSLVAERYAERFESIQGRFQNLLFQRIQWGTPKFEAYWERIPVGQGRTELARAMLMRSGEIPDHPLYEEFCRLTPKRREAYEKEIREEGGWDEPLASFRTPSVREPWAWESELWINQEEMPSANGFQELKSKHPDRTIALARWLEILLPTGELSERGNLLKLMLQQAKDASKDPDLFNPMSVSTRPALQLYYLDLMLRGDGILQFVLVALLEHERNDTPAEAKGTNNLLVEACDWLLLDEDDREVDMLDLSAYRLLGKFRETIAAEGKTTGENYLRPRIELLIDLGLIEKSSARDAIGRLTDVGRHLAETWIEIPDRGVFLERLDTSFMADMNKAHGGTRSLMDTEVEILLYAERAYRIVKRPMGFTPARSIASWASWDAWESGRVLEVGQVMKTLLKAGHGPWKEHFLYSGGSRLDEEYLLKINPSLESAISSATAARIPPPLFMNAPQPQDSFERE